MRVVGGRGVGHGARAARVEVAQVVGQLLHLVRRDVAVVAHHVVARGPRRALDGLVRHLPGGMLVSTVWMLLSIYEHIVRNRYRLTLKTRYRLCF